MDSLYISTSNSFEIQNKFISKTISSMESKKSNKISEIVRLQQILKKWRKLANAPKPSTTTTTTTTTSGGGCKSIKFLKKTLSFNDNSVASVANDVVPKGFLAVCVGKELKRFIIPTEYLSHRAFGILLREAEEEFGFQNEGVLRIPCEVRVFEKILKVVEEKKEVFFMQEFGFGGGDQMDQMVGCCSSEADFTLSLHPHKPLCR